MKDKIKSKIKENKYINIYVLITLISNVIAFVIGYITHKSSLVDFFGPVFDGIIAELTILPILIIIFSIITYIKYNKIKKVFKYIIYSFITVFFVNIIILTPIKIKGYKREIEYKELLEKMNKIKEDNEKYVENTIGETILKEYNNAKFSMDGDINEGICDVTHIDLYGYDFNNRPNLKNENIKWSELSSNLDYECPIRIHYHFNNNRDDYAYFWIDSHYIEYSSFGLEENEKEIISSYIKEFLNEKNYKFEISYHGSTIYVKIPKKIADDEKWFERRLWGEYLERYQKDYRQEIEIKYYNPADNTKFDAIRYNPNRYEWNGKYEQEN